jgi:hypothetical protein
MTEVQVCFLSAAPGAARSQASRTDAGRMAAPTWPSPPGVMPPWPQKAARPSKPMNWPVVASTVKVTVNPVPAW